MDKMISKMVLLTVLILKKYLDDWWNSQKHKINCESLWKAIKIAENFEKFSKKMADVLTGQE